MLRGGTRKVVGWDQAASAAGPPLTTSAGWAGACAVSIDLLFHRRRVEVGPARRAGPVCSWASFRPFRSRPAAGTYFPAAFLNNRFLETALALGGLSTGSPSG